MEAQDLPSYIHIYIYTHTYMYMYADVYTYEGLRVQGDRSPKLSALMNQLLASSGTAHGVSTGPQDYLPSGSRCQNERAEGPKP